MRKENKVFYNYLSTLRSEITTLMNQVKTCKPEDLHFLLDTAMSSPELEKQSDRIDHFIRKIEERTK